MSNISEWAVQGFAGGGIALLFHIAMKLDEIVKILRERR